MKGGTLMRILKDLFCGTVVPWELPSSNSPELKKARQELSDFGEELQNRFSDEEFALIEEYLNKGTNLMSLEMEEAFIYGFRLGGQILLDILEPFSQSTH